MRNTPCTALQQGLIATTQKKLRKFLLTYVATADTCCQRALSQKSENIFENTTEFGEAPFFLMMRERLKPPAVWLLAHNERRPPCGGGPR